MEMGNPDISMDIHTAILLILRGEKSVTHAVADIMRMPLEQVVDGCVYQFELVRECDTGGVNSDSSPISIPQTKRISHYDLADAVIAYGYYMCTAGKCSFVAMSDKGTLRAIKIREVV